MSAKNTENNPKKNIKRDVVLVNFLIFMNALKNSIRKKSAKNTFTINSTCFNWNPLKRITFNASCYSFSFMEYKAYLKMKTGWKNFIVHNNLIPIVFIQVCLYELWLHWVCIITIYMHKGISAYFTHNMLSLVQFLLDVFVWMQKYGLYLSNLIPQGIFYYKFYV